MPIKKYYLNKFCWKIQSCFLGFAVILKKNAVGHLYIHLLVLVCKSFVRVCFGRDFPEKQNQQEMGGVDGWMDG